MRKPPENLVFICNDADSKWHYCPDNNCYYRIYDGKREFTYLSGAYLPDPEFTLTDRIDRFKANNPDKPIPIDELKCTPAIYELWAHRKNIVDANKNPA